MGACVRNWSRVYQAEILKHIHDVSDLAGADTTVALIVRFYLAMTLYPDVQQRAQEEIDNIIGAQRLPDYSEYVLPPSLSNAYL